MALNIHQIYEPQIVDGFYQDRDNASLQPRNQIYGEPVIQKHQVYGDPTVPQQNYAEHFTPQHTKICRKDHQQHAQIDRAEGIHQTTIYRELHQEVQPSPQPKTQDHALDLSNKKCESNSDLAAHYPAVQQQNYADEPISQDSKIYKENFPQLTQIYRTEDIQKHTVCRSPQPVIQAHICYICKKTSKSKSDLAAHYAGHTGEKAIICDACHKCFALKSQLRTHYFTHTGEKNHICEICYRGFSQKSNLNRHYLVHSADREGKRNKGKRKKNEEEAIGHEDQIITAIPIPIVKQQQQDIHVHAERDHCKTTAAEYSGSN